LKETELRAEVEKVRDLTDEAWQYLSDIGFVGEAVEEEGEAQDDPVRYLLAELDRLYATAPPRAGITKPRGRATQGERVPPQLSDYELERSELFSEYMAKLAAPDVSLRETTEGPIPVFPAVAGFRRKYLDDTLLSPEEARALLTSPVAAHWPYSEFGRQGISVVGHSYHIDENKRDDNGPYAVVQVSVPSPRNPSFKDRRRPETGRWEWPSKRRDVRTNETPRRDFKTGYPPHEKAWKILPFPGVDGYTHRTVVQPLSVLGALHDTVSHLIQRYPWEEPDAVWFVLTGETPWVVPLTWQFRGIGAGLDAWSYGYITLKVEPWVSARVVERVYSDVQHQLLGKDNKRVGEKNRELFRFVINRMGPGGSWPKARELVKEWDQEYPQWRYGHDDTQQVRRFRRDYNLARRFLTSPSYELSEE
jgi:hypothetical protein